MAMTPTARSPGRRSRASTACAMAAKTGYLYYTSTAQKVFMRVPVDPATLEPVGYAGVRRRIDNADDFCIDEDAGFAYVTRHRANTLDRVPLAPRHGSEVRHLAGDPFDPVLVGPSSASWGRGPGDHGRVMFVTTDGGTTAPPDGVVRRARSCRLASNRNRTRCALNAGHRTSDLTHEGELMSRHSEMVTAGEVPIERYVHGKGPDDDVVPSYGRDGGDDPPPSDAPLNESDGVLGTRVGRARHVVLVGRDHEKLDESRRPSSKKASTRFRSCATCRILRVCGARPRRLSR